MKKPNILDRAIMTMAPVHAAKRAAARVALSVIKSGYGSYGANLTKKSMRGWMYHGGSAKEDIEDNIDILQQRSRDAYMGIPTATVALKTMRTNVVAGGLMPAPQLDSDYLGLDETAVEKLQAQFVLEFANAQLLELRYYDAMLDAELPRMYDRIAALRRLATHVKLDLRALGADGFALVEAGEGEAAAGTAVTVELV